MAFGARTVASYDVAFNVNLGQVRSDLGEVGAVYARTTGQMSEEALRLTLAQDRLTKAIARSGPQSTAAKAATLAYRREVASLRGAQTQATTTAGHHVSALRQEERQLERTGRGALAASGLFRGLGRSVAFASSTFLGGYGLVYAVESATKAAAHQQVAEGQLETALKNRGVATAETRRKVEELAAANAKLGFGELDTTKALTLAVTATGSLAGATRILSVAQNIARAKGVDLSDASTLLVRAYEGQSRALKALGIDVTKGAKGFQILDEVQAKYAGRAVAYSNSSAGAQARLNAELERTKVTIGRELLPVEVKIANAVADWLGKTKNQERLQRDVNHILKEGTSVVHGVADAYHAVAPPVRIVNRLLGGTEHSVKLLAIALLGLKLRGLAADFGLLRVRTVQAGASAATAAGEYNALATAEGRAAAAGRGIGGNPIGSPVGQNPFSPGARIPNRDLRAPGGLPGLVGGLGGLAAIGISLVGSVPDSIEGGGTTIPIIGAHGTKFSDTHYFSVSPPKWKLGQTITWKGHKYIFALQNGQPVLIAPEILKRAEGASYAGPSPNALTTLVPGSGTDSTPRRRRRRPPSLQGQYNLLTLKLAQDQATASTADDDRDLKAQLAIVNKQIAHEKNLAAKTALVDQRNGILATLQQHRDDAAQTAADKATKKAEARAKKREVAAKAARAREKALNAKIARLYKEDIAGATSNAVQALKDRSDYLNKKYGLGGATATAAKAAATGGSTAEQVRQEQRQFLASVQRILGAYAPNSQPANPGGRAETHLYELVHESRRQVDELALLNRRHAFPASGFALASAGAALG